MLVDIRHRVAFAKREVSTRCIDALARAFTYVNPQFAKVRALGKPTWNVPRVYTTWEENGDLLTFPRGGLARMLDILSQHGYSYTLRDRREHGSPSKPFTHTLTPWPYQREMIRAAIAREQCIIRSPTGSGKTTVLIGIAAELRVPTLVIVHTAALLKQWIARAKKELGLTDREIGVIRGAKVSLKPFTLTVQKTMAGLVMKSEEVRNYFGAVICDEVHMFAAKTFIQTIDPFPARYRIGASDNEKRHDRREFLIYDMFGEVAASATREQLVSGGYVMDVEIRVVPTDFRASWYGMRDGGKIDFVELCKEMAKDDARNALACDVVDLESKGSGQVLVLAHHTEHVEKLGQLLVKRGHRVGYLYGKDEKEYDRTIARLHSGELQVAVGTYAASGTGIDLPSLGAIVGVTPIAGNEQFLSQVRGRACRVSSGKDAARLYILWDRFIHRSHLANVKRWNKTVTIRNSEGEWEPA